MRKDACSESVSLVLIQQIEFTEAKMVGMGQPRQRANGNITMVDHKKGFFSEANTMDLPLILFIPRPARANMRAKSFLLNSE